MRTLPKATVGALVATEQRPIIPPKHWDLGLKHADFTQPAATQRFSDENIRPHRTVVRDLGTEWHGRIPSAPCQRPASPCGPSQGPQWQQWWPWSSGPESLHSMGIRVANTQKLHKPQPHNNRAMNAFGSTELSCGTAKLHGTKGFQRAAVSLEDAHANPCRATLAQFVDVQERCRVPL